MLFRSLMKEMNDVGQHETSFESLPAYLPSTSWLADSGNNYYYSRLPPRDQEQHRILSGCPAELSRKRRVVKPQPQDHLGAQGRECGHRAKMDRRSLSDNECCASQNINKNPPVPSSSKQERFCARCLTKRRALMSVPEARPIKRREVPVSLWDDALATSRYHPRKRVAGRSNISAVHKEDQTRGESSENGSCRAKPKGLEDPARAPEPRRPLSTKKQVEKCPVGPHAKLQDKLCACQAHLHATWEGPRRHRRVVREDNEENQAVPPQNRCRHVDPHYLEPKWRTGKPPLPKCVTFFFCDVTQSSDFKHQISLSQRELGRVLGWTQTSLRMQASHRTCILIRKHNHKVSIFIVGFLFSVGMSLQNLVKAEGPNQLTVKAAYYA